MNARLLRNLRNDELINYKKIVILLMHALVEEMLGFEPEDGEDDSAGVDRREGVADGDQDDVTDAVGPWGVVAPERDDRSKGKSVGVENLDQEPDLVIESLVIN